MRQEQMVLDRPMDEIKEEPVEVPMVPPPERWNYKEVVDELKSQDLLSYLYNVLLEADQPLVRNLFCKALKPYLSFISHFIYRGEFNDPFYEFYIR